MSESKAKGFITVTPMTDKYADGEVICNRVSFTDSKGNEVYEMSMNVLHIASIIPHPMRLISPMNYPNGMDDAECMLILSNGKRMLVEDTYGSVLAAINAANNIV